MASIRMNVTRKAAMPVINRSAVKSGEVFTLVKRDGSLGSKKYIALGHNGKLFSLNIANGELASSQDVSKRITVLGKAVFTATSFDPAAKGRATSRSQVRTNEVFRVKGGGKIYMNLGRLRDGNYVAVNVNKATGEDYAVGRDGSKNVEVLSTWEARVEIV